jgi:hypothetical protein
MNIRGPLGQKAPKPERGTARAKRHLAAVKALPCVICGMPGPSDAHHVFHDRYGTGKASDFATIPLCKLHHQDGPEAIHNGKATWREKHGPDYGFLEQVRADIERNETIDF